MDINALHAEQRAGKRKQPQWMLTGPNGHKRMKYNQTLAARFCRLLAQTELSITDLLKAHPELPTWHDLESWRAKKPEFNELWRKARESQAHHLIQLSLTLARHTNPKNAHSQRVKFDIYKWVASKFHPTEYGDKPAQTAVNVAVGFNISTERLNEIRAKLDVTRDAYISKSTAKSNGNSDTQKSDTQKTDPSQKSGPLSLLNDSHVDH